MKHIRPHIVTAQKVISHLGKGWICPYCKCETPVSGDDDITWVPVPIESSPQRYMCLGCCEDIHSTCATDDFENHPYKDIVADAAQSEGFSVIEFRLLCLRQQINAGELRCELEQSGERYRKRLARLKSLVDSLS